jgi:8-oxo-dGTP diphosphatase
MTWKEDKIAKLKSLYGALWRSEWETGDLLDRILNELLAKETEIRVLRARTGMADGKLTHEADIEDEAEFLEAYRKQEYPKPSVTADLVIFTVWNSDLKVLLVKRGGHPYKGFWALPGGFVDVGNAYDDQGESIEAAAARELGEETSLPAGSCFLEQLYTFGEPYRDKRTRTITVAYYALIPSDLAKMAQPGDDAVETKWASVSEGVGDLAFDHNQILDVALDRIRGKVDYAPIAFHLVPEHFTVPELRSVYEAIKGAVYDPSNFRRRFKRMMEDGIIEEAPGKRAAPTGRPAKVYRFVTEKGSLFFPATPRP